MAPRVLVGVCFLWLNAGCDSAGEAEAPAAEATAVRVQLTPQMVHARLKVDQANLEMGETEVNGLRLSTLQCSGVKRPLLGGMAIVGAVAKQKSALDACAPAGDAVVATWTSEAGPLKKLEVAGSSSGKTDACIEKGLAQVSSPFAATCAAIVMVGDAAGADAAAKALLGE